MVILNNIMFVNSTLTTSKVLLSSTLGLMTVGDKIRQLRKERGWSQSDLAGKLGVKPQNISRSEQNRVQPRESTLKIFAEVFELPLEEFQSLASTVDIPDLDPEMANYIREIPTLSAKDQEAVKSVLKALITAKKAQKLFAS